jgi:filamentous hemagglutinin
MTSRLEERAAEQLLERQITIGKIPGLDGLNAADARAVEQTLIDSFKLGKNGGSLINKINSISKTTDPEYYINSILRGIDLLNKAGYPGF